MARSVVQRVGEAILLDVSDDRGDPHSIVFTRDEADQLGHALILKARTEGHDALDDLIRRVDY